MNIHNGEILGLGSFPTFDPSVFTRPMTQSQVNALYRDPIAAPLTDRAIAGLYPTGSTFKLITAIAALESGHLTPTEVIYRPGGQLVVGGEDFQNAGGAAYGPVSLVSALRSLLRRLLLHARAADVGHRRPPALGAHAGDRSADRDRPAREPEGLLPEQAVAQQALRGRRNRTPLVGRRQRAARRPGRATCRPTRCRWRSPTRRSATAARW